MSLIYISLPKLSFNKINVVNSIYKIMTNITILNIVNNIYLSNSSCNKTKLTSDTWHDDDDYKEQIICILFKQILAKHKHVS